MRHFFMRLFCFPLIGFLFQACGEKEEISVTPIEVKSIKGIASQYTLGQHELLVINPEIEFSQGDISDAKFEWGIGGKTVSTEKKLNVPMSELGTFDAYFKIYTSKNGEIYEFKVRVSSPSYDKGLLLLSEANGRAMLTFKRLDDMQASASPGVFKANNPNAVLGAVPLSVCWTGEGITNPNNIEDSGSLYIAISSDNPQKTYLLDSQTLKINSEVTYRDEGIFKPEHITASYGSQNFLWSQEQLVYFIGGGKEFPYLTGEDKNFIKSRKRHTIPDDVRLANLSCNVITNPTDFVRVYYDLNGKRLVYVAGIRGTVLGKIACGVTPLNLLACNGQYADANADGRYEPREVMLVGNEGGKVKLLRFAPAANKAEESLIKEIDATGHIEPTAATTVNPIKPILYYSDSKGNIFSLNYENSNFTDEPYISLGERFTIQSLIFDPYNPETLYIAAEDKTEKTDMKASIFIYNVKDPASSRRLFEGHRVGGKIRRMIYKGNGLEHLTQH